MAVNFDDQQIVFKFGKFYRVSSRSTADGAVTTEETELRDWNASTELSQHSAQPLIAPSDSDIAPLTPVTEIGEEVPEQPANVNRGLNLDLGAFEMTSEPVEHPVSRHFSMTFGGGAGNDTLEISFGDYAQMFGGDGNDTLDISWGDNNQIVGGNGNDTLDMAGGDNNRMFGGDGNDTLDISWGDNNQIVGGNGNDTLDMAGGDYAQMFGGDGNDTLDISWGDNNRMFGGTGNDTLHLSDGNNVVMAGGDGNDTLNLSSGNNAVMTGGDGDDTIVLLRGNDAQIFGGNGNDIIQIGTVCYAMTFDEIVQAGSFDAIIDLIDLHDYQLMTGVFGGDGNDIISVHYGYYSYIDGGSGDDTIYGGAGSNGINGGTGNDDLWGGLNPDEAGDFLPFGIMFFGPEEGRMPITPPSNDTFIFEQNSGNDTIHDFTISGSTAENDRIDIHDYHFTDFNAVLAASAQEASGVRISFDANDSVLLTGISLSMLTAQNFIF